MTYTKIKRKELELVDVPAESMAFARERTHPYCLKLMWMLIAGEKDALTHVLASAYLQGVWDGAQVCDKLKRRKRVHFEPSKKEKQ